jgi:hypothetical protein
MLSCPAILIGNGKLPAEEETKKTWKMGKEGANFT